MMNSNVVLFTATFAIILVAGLAAALLCRRWCIESEERERLLEAPPAYTGSWV